MVDPDVLRAFASRVDTAAAVMDIVDIGGTAGRGADGLDGSETQWAMRQVGTHVGQAANDLIKDVDSMGTAVRGAGDAYEVEDTTLAGTFGQLF